MLSLSDEFRKRERRRITSISVDQDEDEDADIARKEKDVPLTSLCRIAEATAAICPLVCSASS